MMPKMTEISGKVASATSKSNSGRGEIKNGSACFFCKRNANFADAGVKAEFVMGWLCIHSGLAIFQLD